MAEENPHPAESEIHGGTSQSVESGEESGSDVLLESDCDQSGSEPASDEDEDDDDDGENSMLATHHPYYDYDYDYYYCGTSSPSENNRQLIAVENQPGRLIKIPSLRTSSKMAGGTATKRTSCPMMRPSRPV